MNRQTPVDLEKPRPSIEPQEIPGVSPRIPAAPPEKRPVKSKWRWVWWLIALAAIAVLVRYQWTNIKNYLNPPAPTRSGGRNKGGGGPVSVVAAKAQRGNVGVYFTALGAVTPIYTVTVKSRVDGQLMKVMFQEGQMVKQGDPLMEIDTRPYQAALDQAQGNLARDEALLKNAQIDLARYKVLVGQQAIPEQQYATQEALVQQYAGTIQTDQATVDNAKLNLVYCHITSPINGLVGLRLVDPGNIVHAADTNGLLVITQMDPISVIFTLAEDQLPAVLAKLNANQHLSVEAWDRDLKNKLAQGTLQTIDNQIDPTTGTLKLRADFDNKNRMLFPSQFVNVRLLLEEKYGVTLVPSAAIQHNSQNAYVWLVQPDRTVTIRNVMTGVVEGEQTQVTDGLNPGDAVVTVGVDRLQEGGKVTVDMPNGNGKRTGANSGGNSGSDGGKS